MMRVEENLREDNMMEGGGGDKGIKNKEKVEIRPRVSKLKIRVLIFL